MANISVECIDKFRDKHNCITGYRLKDCCGNTRDVTPEVLKKFIGQGKIRVTNLTLTSDNRLIDSAAKQVTTVENNKASIENIVRRIFEKSGFTVDNSTVNLELDKCKAESYPLGKLGIRLYCEYGRAQVIVEISCDEINNFIIHLELDSNKPNEIIEAIVSNVNRFKDVETTTDVNKLISIINFIATNRFDSMAEMNLDFAFYRVCELSKKQDIIEHGIQSRIDYVINSSKLMRNITESVVKDSSSNDCDEYSVRYLINSKILGTAISGNLSDYNCILLASESDMIDSFNFNRQSNVAATKNSLVKALHSYGEYRVLMESVNSSLFLLEDLYDLDSYIYTKAGLELARCNDSFETNSDGTFTLDNVLVDLSTEKAYNALVRICKVFNGDSQLKDLLRIVVKSLNE